MTYPAENLYFDVVSKKFVIPSHPYQKLHAHVIAVSLNTRNCFGEVWSLKKRAHHSFHTGLNEMTIYTKDIPLLRGANFKSKTDIERFLDSSFMWNFRMINAAKEDGELIDILTLRIPVPLYKMILEDLHKERTDLYLRRGITHETSQMSYKCKRHI